MPYDISRSAVWAGELEDRPGALAAQLDALQRAGVNLETAILRPSAPLSGTGVLFVAPLLGPAQERAAEQIGMRRCESIHVVRVAGPDHPGLMSGIAHLLADSGLNISGLSGAGTGDRAILYIRFDCSPDAERAISVLQAKLV